MNQTIEEYIQTIRHEIEQLSPNFTGNVEFRLNFKEGACANMNIVKGKSIKIIDNRNA